MKGTIYAGMTESLHSVRLASLQAASLYHFRVKNRDAAAQEPGCRGFTATALLGTRSRQ
jgi:hypothetical protein